MRQLQLLPRFADKLSYLYVEHAVIEQEAKSIAVFRKEETFSVPAASLGLLILGPGTKISHAAVRALADNNCQLIWAGEHGVRFYAHGLGGSHHSRNLIRQARLVSNELTRLQVVVRMYSLRFQEDVDPNLSLQQLRGKEGVRVRQTYSEMAREFGVQWKGRDYKRQKWDHADPLNRALSSANACLYGLVHAAILSGGYSPALGFIHCGKQQSFVYDVADLYKTEITIPVAFATVAAGPTQLERQVRIACREIFRQERVMERILPDIAHCLDVPDAQAALQDEYANDPAKPSSLWDPATLQNDIPIGKILKMDAGNAIKIHKEPEDDRDDTGEGDNVASR